MPTYKYRAKKGAKEILEGRIDADSEKAAVEKLSLEGYLPLSLKEEVSAIGGKRGHPHKITVLAGARVKSSQVTVFSRQLASLLRAGVPILAALNIIKEQSESKHFKSILGEIHDAVKQGMSFSSALAYYPKAFSFLYVAMVHSGEDSGTLAEALLRLADYRRQQEEMFSRLRMALIYPLFMAIVGAATIIFMLLFVMPRLMRIFASLGEQLPLPTRILISISHGVHSVWFLIAIIILAVFMFIIRRQLNTEKGRVSLSLFKLHLPIFGSFTLKAELARFCRTLELLIKNGISILKAIELSIPVLDNEIIKRQIKNSCQQLEQGSSFGGSLKDAKVFPVFMSNLIIVGEESGKLDGALAEIAGSYERDTDEAMRAMASLFEPLMILGMGLIVGFIVVAMLLPMFEMNIMVR